MKLRDLAPNPDNPRVISDKKLALLRRTLEEFGDLGGIVFNRTTKRLVGGHQRVKALGGDGNADVQVERKYARPTKVGTVAEGYVVLATGERLRYREVAWDEQKEKAANIAANKGVGEWDLPKLGEWLQELNDFGFDVDLTLFDDDERKRLFGGAPLDNDAEGGDGGTPPEFKSVYEVVVVCTDEADQASVYERLSGEGLTCRVLSM